MTDIHCHIIPFVDDGSRTTEVSLEMLREEVRQGVNRIICTPHYRRGFYERSEEEIKNVLEELSENVRKEGIPVELYLGREVKFHAKEYKSFLEKRVVPTMCGGDYVLLEFNYDMETDIDEVVYDTQMAGYKPIIAHIERYSYFRKVENVARIKAAGAMIQVNADSIASKDFPKERKFVKQLLKFKLADFVGSDVHSGRVNYMKKAYDKVAKKDRVYADMIFDKNADLIIGQNRPL